MIKQDEGLRKSYKERIRNWKYQTGAGGFKTQSILRAKFNRYKKLKRNQLRATYYEI